MTNKYISPLRPLDIGYVAKHAGVGIDWDNTDIGPDWTRDKVYAFDAPLSPEVVASFQLEPVVA